jgi:type I restriction enzyme M protein
MARVLDPQPGMTVYDPACGSGGLLIKCHLRLLDTHGVVTNGHRELPPDIAPLQLFGQEINPSTYAIARMNAVLHDMDADIALGDTARRPAFIAADGHMKRFDLVTANPMWNQDIDEAVYRNDPHERFSLGIPPPSSADWGWVQHMVASITSGGRMAVVLDTGSVSRGSGSQGTNRERDIRRALVEQDLVEAVILLPDNLFYNTPAPGIVMVLNRAKRHLGEILLVNASQMFAKGRPKNFLKDSDIAEIADIYHHWRTEHGRSAVVPVQKVRDTDYNLSPSRFVASAPTDDVLPLDEAWKLFLQAEAERVSADEQLRRVIADLGVQ